LMEIPGIGEKMVEKIAAAVKQHFEPEAVAAAPGEAAAAPAAPEAGAPAEETPAEETEVAAETSDGEPHKGD